MIVIDIKTGQPHKVWKYLLSGDEQQNVWCHDWYGHHIIGDDCVFAKSVEYSSNQNNKPLVKADVSVNEVAVKLSSFLEAQKDCPPQILEAVNKDFWNLI